MELVEKIRLSLWDLFTFFLSGFFLILIICIFGMAEHFFTFNQIESFLISLPTAIALLLFPLFCTLLGMLLEPLSNRIDKIFINRVWSWISSKPNKQTEEEKTLEKFIIENHLGNLGKVLPNPYHFCKEYVETKQLSTTFMVYLSRFGFYRNATFLTVGSAIYTIVIFKFSFITCGISAALLVTGYFLKCRAEDFYGYMAPAVYRCYLIDKLKIGSDAPNA